MEIRFVVERLNVLIDQIRQLEKRFQTLMVDQQKLLQTIPGLGKVWAPTVLAEILPVFQPDSKHGARKLVATAGVDVRLTESGDKKGQSGAVDICAPRSCRRLKSPSFAATIHSSARSTNDRKIATSTTW